MQTSAARVAQAAAAAHGNVALIRAVAPPFYPFARSQSMSVATPQNRNAPCFCGSGKRFKHCHGSMSAVAPPIAPRDQALAAHRAGLLGRAEALYREALAADPNDVDCLHLLGVVQMERMRYRDALDLMWEAAERTDWAVRDIRHNLGLAIGKLLARDANVRQADLLEAFVARERERVQRNDGRTPLVSVVLPAFNHAEYVADAIASVAAQTYRNIELIVIDDGSTDATAAVIAASVRSLSIPVQFVSRENRGAPATLNEGAGLARGQYLAFLNSDDYYAPERIAALVAEVANAGLAWGFTLVTNAPQPASMPAGAVSGDILQRQRNFLGTQPNSFTLVEYNVAVSTGNLFVEREFFQALGGFRDYRYNHDWDFCLRAMAREEPVIVARPLYFYRFHGRNTIAEDQARSTADANRVVEDFLATALTGAAPSTNPLGPHARENRSLLLKLAFRAGQGALVPVPILKSLAAEARAAPDPALSPAAGVAPAEAPPRTALVVLGMHRSGTSAMARVLNLCGAHLPAKLKPPKLGVNPKGFWEPEAVLDLNVRIMRQLGGDWSHVEFPLPAGGEVVEEFATDAADLLRTEYEGRPTILLKDPRMCILAPLWDKALRDGGYRPAYVVPIRHPLEVARSLEARGDMTEAEGLALWLAYMRRVAAFAEGRRDVIYVGYDALLEDWRLVVERISERLGVALPPGERGAAIDDFLERDLRTQAVDTAALDALPPGALRDDVRALYAACLARCDADATPMARAESLTLAAPAPGRDAAAAMSVGYVLCIENNAIRDQALLLCESIRRFAGRHRDGPIFAFAPRPGLGVDAATQRRLADLGVEYIDAPLNTACLDYAPANRVFAGGYAERHARTDFLIVLDSDTVWLDEPALPLDADAAARPVDSKGSATRGPGDRFEAYWETLARMAGTTLDRLPIVHSTIGNERIRVSYNAGLTVVRRDKGILTRCAELFAASLSAGMRPYRGTGMNIYASTGEVGREGSEFWGSSQAALTLAIWATTDRVVHYPDCYNVPLHLIAADGAIDPRWRAQPPVHLHYHYMFGERHHEVAMELLAQLGLADDRRQWLLERTPFRDPQEDLPRGRAVVA